MNELIVNFGKDWLCFQTDKNKAGEAFGELIEKLSDIGVNIDNMTLCKLSLRNKDGVEIDRIVY